TFSFAACMPCSTASASERTGSAIAPVAGGCVVNAMAELTVVATRAGGAASALCPRSKASSGARRGRPRPARRERNRPPPPPPPRLQARLDGVHAPAQGFRSLIAALAFQAAEHDGRPVLLRQALQFLVHDMAQLAPAHVLGDRDGAGLGDLRVPLPLLGQPRL